MPDLFLMPAAQKTLCQPRQQIQAPVGLPPQKCSPIEIDGAPSKWARSHAAHRLQNPKPDSIQSVMAKGILSLDLTVV
jgi:hypothetical protein